MSLPPRPAVTPSPPWSFPVAQRALFDNGLQVLVYQLPGQHVVAAGLSLDLPLTTEPRALEGVAALTVGTLDEGTAQHPGQAFAEAVERCGAELTGSVGYSGTRLFLDVPASRLETGLSLLGEAERHGAMLALGSPVLEGRAEADGIALRIGGVAATRL